MYVFPHWLTKPRLLTASYGYRIKLTRRLAFSLWCSPQLLHNRLDGTASYFVFLYMQVLTTVTEPSEYSLVSSIPLFWMPSCFLSI